jgi:hypothetical protein
VGNHKGQVITALMMLLGAVLARGWAQPDKQLLTTLTAAG